MQQRKIVEDYLNSVIPQKISETTKARLRAEIECHICDRADFYMEIGYDEDAAFEKAIEQMGEGEEVKVEFESLYEDSSLKGVLIFLYISAVNLISVAFNLGYWFLDHNHWTENPSVAELFLCLCNFVFIIVYTIKCFRRNLVKQLKGITFAYALMALGSIVISGIFFPVIFAGEYVVCYIINDSASEGNALSFVLNIVVLCISAIVMFVFVYVGGEGDVPREKPYFLSLKQITSILSVVCACFIVLYGLALAKYEFDYDFLSGQNLYSETPQEEFLPNITSEQRKVYASIKNGDKVAETEKLLESKGFIKQEEKIEDYFYDYSCLTLSTDEYILNQLKNTEFSFYLYTEEMKEVDYEWDDIVSCIIIAYDNSGQINYKMFIPSVGGGNRYRNYSHGEQTRKWFDNLQKSESAESALEFIRGVDSEIIEDEKFDGKNSYNTYIIEFWSHHPFEPTFTDLVFSRSTDYEEYYYVFEITAENGIIADFKQINH